MTRLLPLFLFFFLTIGCESLHSIGKNPSAEELFQHGLKLKEKSYYQESLNYFRKLKSRFLYSRLSKEADLEMADIYFSQEEWKKATKAYWSFSELYPRHPKADFVLFRLALSYFHQLPTTEDRDLSLSQKTLFYLNRHLKLFPKSPHRSETKKHKEAVLNLLAQKQWMIVRFHLNQGKPHSALPYVLKLMKDYSSLLPSKAPEKQAGLPSLKKLKELAKELKTAQKKI